MIKEQEKKTFKLKSASIDGVNSLGKMVVDGDIAIQALIEWAHLKEKQCYDSVHRLRIDPNISNEIISYNLGEARAVREDLLGFLKTAEVSFLNNRRKEV